MDFIERLTEKINTLELPNHLVKGYLDANESLVIYPIPGGRTIREYMNGDEDKRLNYEIAYKSKSQEKLSGTLWELQTFVDELEELESENDSFQFNDIAVTNTPYINSFDDQGWYVFLLDIQAEITIFK